MLRILGTLEIERSGGRFRPAGRRERATLSLLLLRANELVPLDDLIRANWDDPPTTARQQIHSAISRLRGLLDGVDHVRLETLPACYRLCIAEAALDLLVFQRLVASGRMAAAGARFADAAECLRDALDLFPEPALTDLPTELMRAEATRLAELRLQTLEERIAADLECGQDHLVPELTGLVEAHPYREQLHGYLMTALSRAGRTAEALAVYRRTRNRMVADLGVEPGPELQAVQLAVLSAAPFPVQPPADAGALRPANLPPDLSGFVGRADHLGRLDALATGQSTVSIAVISGAAGIGKTALAVHWAHHTADRFPDGLLHANLRGFGPNGFPLEPAEALRGFLALLNVPARRIPPDPDGRADLYRSLLAGKRVLVVLDNARDAEQVRPLLPATPGSMVLVTSRNRLLGLVAATNAQPLTVDLMSYEEGRALLAARIGASRVEAEPSAVDELIGRCARLPLALVVVAARAAAHPTFPLAAIADELGDAGTGLDAFVDSDPEADVRTVFSWSYGTLSEGAATLFRLLGSHPGPDAGLRGAASLAGIPVTEASTRLAELERAHLTSQVVPGRFAMHDLLRAYAAELGSPADQRAAVHRVLDHYLHTAHAAALVLEPHREALRLPRPTAGVHPETPADLAAALAWYAAEHDVLLAAIDRAASAGFDTHTWQLAWTVTDYLQRRGHWQEQATIHAAALAAATRLGDRRTEARAHRHLARAEILLGRFDDAYAHYERAVDLSRDLADHAGEAHAHMNVANLLEREDRCADALGHGMRALDLFTVAGNRDGQARCHNMVGWYQAKLGDHAAALASCGRALAMHRELGDQWGEAATLDSLGYTHHQLGDYHEAAACYEQAVDIMSAHGDRHMEATILSHLAATLQAMSEVPAAAEVWGRALVIFEELGDADAARIRTALDALGAA